MQKKLAIPLADGLYRVINPYLCGGFVIRAGAVVICAPILRKNMDYWMSIAKPVKELRSQTPVAQPVFRLR